MFSSGGYVGGRTFKAEDTAGAKDQKQEYSGWLANDGKCN